MKPVQLMKSKFGILPDGITAQSWTGRNTFNNKTVADQQMNIKEWNTANTSFSDPNKAYISVWKNLKNFI